jgi:hypothetical protein
MPVNKQDPDYNSYLGVRYLSPDFIRSLRGGLDLKIDPKVYERKFKKTLVAVKGNPTKEAQAEAALGALRYMLRNPLAGVVRWTEGEQYVWRDDDPASAGLGDSNEASEGSPASLS